MIQLLAMAPLLFGLQEGPPDEARIRVLIDRLGDDFLDEREAARRELEKAGEAAGPALIAALDRRDFRVRRACVDLLARLKDPAALDRVGAVFRTDEDPSVRDAAFLYLRTLGRPAEDPLIDALESEKAEHRREAAKALTEFLSGKCAARMFALYENDPDRAVREQAFEYLKTVGKPAEPWLLRLLESADPAVRRGALEGLGKARGEGEITGGEILSAVSRAFASEGDAAVLKEAYDYLRAAGPGAEDAFLSGLRSPQAPVRDFSIQGLIELKSERAIDPVAKVFLEDDSEDARRRACEFLKSRGPAAEEALVRGLSSGNRQVRLLAIPALGEIRSLKPMEKVSRLFREDPDPEIHRAAFDYLKGIGAPAEKDLIHALSDPDRQIRGEAIRALGLMKSRAAIGRLVDFLGQLDPEVRKAAEDALVHIGRPAVDAVLEAVKSGRLKQRSGDAILALHLQEEVERLLDARITDEGGSGYYAGMFADLEAFGKDRARPVLRRIVSEEGYAWRLPLSVERERSYDWPRKMQELAVMALGELGDASDVPALREALRAASPGPGEDIAEELVVALHRLGEKEPLDGFAKQARARAEEAFRDGNLPDGCAALFQLGLVQNRVGRREEAEKTYLDILKRAEAGGPEAGEVDCLPVVFYNLACLGALRRDRAGAIRWLRKAVEAGFRDREWIRMDRDLESLRGEEGFKSLLADDALFEKKPPE